MKRSPAPTGTVSVESHPVFSNHTEQKELRSNEKLKTVRALLALPMQDMSVFDSFVPAPKRQRMNFPPTQTETGPIQTLAPSISIHRVQQSFELVATRTAPQNLATIATFTTPGSVLPSTGIVQKVLADKSMPFPELLRNLTTVNEVWQEYKYGLYGNPSIESVDSIYGKSWLKNKTEAKYYSNRKKIYNYVIDAENNGKSAEKAINELETLRVSQKWTLNTLQINMPFVWLNEATGLLEPGKTVYLLWRNLTTVPQVWQEYKYGLNGGPSVESIVKKYGPAWLRSDTDRKWFYSRKKIYKFVNDEVWKGKPEHETVDKLEKLRIDKKWTLNQLQLNIDTLSVDPETGDPLPTLPAYAMLRNITTVNQVWQEYKYGLYGNPSIKSLEMQYGKSWFKPLGDSRFYYARNKIYTIIKNAIAMGKSEEDAVGELEDTRTSNGWSLYVLQDNL